MGKKKHEPGKLRVRIRVESSEGYPYMYRWRVTVDGVECFDHDDPSADEEEAQRKAEMWIEKFCNSPLDLVDDLRASDLANEQLRKDLRRRTRKRTRIRKQIEDMDATTCRLLCEAAAQSSSPKTQSQPRSKSTKARSSESTSSSEGSGQVKRSS